MSWGACAAAVRGEATVDEVGETLGLYDMASMQRNPGEGR